jgi:hypothetical protein
MGTTVVQLIFSVYCVEVLLLLPEDWYNSPKLMGRGLSYSKFGTHIRIQNIFLVFPVKTRDIIPI